MRALQKVLGAVSLIEERSPRPGMFGQSLVRSGERKCCDALKEAERIVSRNCEVKGAVACSECFLAACQITI